MTAGYFSVVNTLICIPTFWHSAFDLSQLDRPIFHSVRIDITSDVSLFLYLMLELIGGNDATLISPCSLALRAVGCSFLTS
jgi:hypothetical protein